MRIWGHALWRVVGLTLAAGALGCEVPNPAYDLGKPATDAGSLTGRDGVTGTPDLGGSTPDTVARLDAAFLDAPVTVDPRQDAGELPSLSEGLVAHVAADEGAGSVLADKTGGPSLTAQQSFTWVPGRSGAANDFAIRFGQTGWAGTAPSVASQPLLALTSAMSTSVWIKWDRSRISDQALCGSVGRAWYLRLGTSTFPRLCLTFETTLATVGACTSNDVPLNRWTHVVSTWDGTLMRFFINGVEDQQARRQISGTLKPHWSQEFSIGALGAGGDTFEGALSDFRIYNRALTVQEVTDLAR